MTDKEYMDIAIEISKKAVYPYGAIIVKDNQIIGRSDVDSPVCKSGFAHAEITAIENAMAHSISITELENYIKMHKNALN